jgi:hypothetical protein
MPVSGSSIQLDSGLNKGKLSPALLYTSCERASGDFLIAVKRRNANVHT